MHFMYRAILETDPDGGFLVIFADLPPAISSGENKAQALENGRDALETALLYLAEQGEPSPEANTQTGIPVYVSTDVALKLAVIEAFREAKISKTELAQRLGKRETEARRILNPNYTSSVPMLEKALTALGQRVRVEIEAAE